MGECDCCFGAVRMLLSHNKERAVIYCRLLFVIRAHCPYLLG